MHGILTLNGVQCDLTHNTLHMYNVAQTPKPARMHVSLVPWVFLVVSSGHGSLYTRVQVQEQVRGSMKGRLAREHRLVATGLLVWQ